MFFLLYLSSQFSLLKKTTLSRRNGHQRNAAQWRHHAHISSGRQLEYQHSNKGAESFHWVSKDGPWLREGKQRHHELQRGHLQIPKCRRKTDAFYQPGSCRGKRKSSVSFSMSSILWDPRSHPLLIWFNVSMRQLNNSDDLIAAFT